MEMTSMLEAATEAADNYAEATLPQRLSFAHKLAAEGFSVRQIVELTRLGVYDIQQSVDFKKERTGGRLNVNSVPLLVRFVQGGSEDWSLVAQAYELGTSAVMIARLLGTTKARVEHYIKKAKVA